MNYQKWTRRATNQQISGIRKCLTYFQFWKQVCNHFTFSQRIDEMTDRCSCKSHGLKSALICRLSTYQWLRRLSCLFSLQASLSLPHRENTLSWLLLSLLHQIKYEKQTNECFMNRSSRFPCHLVLRGCGGPTASMAHRSHHTPPSQSELKTCFLLLEILTCS